MFHKKRGEMREIPRISPRWTSERACARSFQPAFQCGAEIFEILVAQHGQPVQQLFGRKIPPLEAHEHVRELIVEAVLDKPHRVAASDGIGGYVARDHAVGRHNGPVADFLLLA